MRALTPEPDPHLLSLRRQRGQDVWDEVWEGVLHMVPPPSSWHQRFASQLFLALGPLAQAKALVPTYETGLFRPAAPGDSDYRTPDLLFAHLESFSTRGVEGRAELVVEALSPRDESHAKLPFYESLGVQEVLLVDPETRQLELYRLRGQRLELQAPDATGALRSEVLEVSLSVAPGPRLLLVWAAGRAEI